MSTYVVSREDLAYNVRILMERAGTTPIWAVVKADGYGLGVKTFATELYALGLRHFCVTEPREAETLLSCRFADIEILMLRQLSDPVEIRAMWKAGVILTVGSLEAADRINAAVDGPASVHLKIDTGMGRYGFLPSQLSEMIAIFRQGKRIRVKGVFTHFNCAFCDDALTKEQFAVFHKTVSALEQAGCDTGIVHCCNSAAFLKFPEMHLGGVRLGSALLGRMSFPTELRPLGIAETTIEELRILPKGHTTGYGAIWRAKRDTTLAIIPVGWCNGLQVSCKEDRSHALDCIRGGLRELKNLLKRPRAYVYIDRVACPIVGAIGSLHCAVDVTHMSDCCRIGDTVKIAINPMHIKGMEVEFR